MNRSDVFASSTVWWSYGNPAGQPIVLVHGFRGDHHGLEGIAQAIAAQTTRFHVIVPDLPGFGSTPAIPNKEHTLDFYGAWLQSFVLTVAPRGATILGHSFGSLVVANATARGMHSNQTVLINPIAAPALEGPKAILTKIAIAYYKTAQALPEKPAHALLSHPAIVRIMSEVMAKTKDNNLRSWIHAQHQAYFSAFSDTSTLAQAFEASVSHTVLEYSSYFLSPTLLIVGDRDDITPLCDQLTLRDRLINSELIVMPGVGHLVHYECVPETAEAVIRFITSHAAGDTPA